MSDPPAESGEPRPRTGQARFPCRPGAAGIRPPADRQPARPTLTGRPPGHPADLPDHPDRSQLELGIAPGPTHPPRSPGPGPTPTCPTPGPTPAPRAASPRRPRPRPRELTRPRPAGPRPSTPSTPVRPRLPNRPRHPRAGTSRPTGRPQPPRPAAPSPRPPPDLGPVRSFRTKFALTKPAPPPPDTPPPPKPQTDQAQTTWSNQNRGLPDPYRPGFFMRCHISWSYEEDHPLPLPRRCSRPRTARLCLDLQGRLRTHRQPHHHRGHHRRVRPPPTPISHSP